MLYFFKHNVDTFMENLTNFLDSSRRPSRLSVKLAGNNQGGDNKLAVKSFPLKRPLKDSNS